MKFAHLSDCHLGGWRQPEMQALNAESFKIAINTCINEKVEFILFSGDLFDSAFPSIEVLKETFAEFKKLKDAGIKSFIIAGSHDYSPSGKTFLEVLEKAGFCEICEYELKENGKILLKPCLHNTYAIYGYPGKKSGLEIEDLKNIYIDDQYSNDFRILMLHTTIDEVKGSLPIESINLKDVPKADYYALGHIHIDFQQEINGKPVIYSGPIFPNNFKELEELKYGRFYIIDVKGYLEITKKEIKLKEIQVFDFEIENSLTATQKIIEVMKHRDLKDKIILLKISGTLKQGKTSDIDFNEIESFLKEQKAYCFLKNTSKLESEQIEFKMQLQTTEMHEIEKILIRDYRKENPSDFNEQINSLMDGLSLEKQEGENTANFESRLLSEVEKVFNIDLK